MPVEYQRIAAVLEQRIENEYEAAMEGESTRKKGMSWSKLTKGSRQLEDACQKIWVKLFRQSSHLEFPDRTRTWRKAALRSWVDEQSGEAPGKMMTTDDEEGSTWPSWLHYIDPHVQSRLAAFKLRDLLPRAAWEQLEADGLSDFGPVEAMWERINKHLNTSSDDVESAMLAALFEHSMVGYVDALLLARMLRMRISEKMVEKFQASADDMVVGTLSGVLSFNEMDTVFGIMEKPGSIGEEKPDSIDEESNESTKEAKQLISKLPKKLCPAQRKWITREALLLEKAAFASKANVDAVATNFEDEVEARKVLLSLPEIGPIALATALFLAKYDKTSPTYRTAWSSLYAGDVSPIAPYTSPQSNRLLTEC